MLNLARPLQREALLLSTRLRKMDDEKIFETEKNISYLVAGGGEGHGLQPLVGDAEVEGGELAQLLGDPLHDLLVNLRHALLNQQHPSFIVIIN